MYAHIVQEHYTLPHPQDENGGRGVVACACVRFVWFCCVCRSLDVHVEDDIVVGLMASSKCERKGTNGILKSR